MKALILGSTGYTGQVLIRLLSSHPEIQEVIASSNSKADSLIQEFDPGLSGPGMEKFASTGKRFVSPSKALKLAKERKVDIVFSALPHLTSAELLKDFFNLALVIIDLSADFRLRDPSVFQKAYSHEVPRLDLLSQAVYGLSEWYTEDIKKADLIANPGCYPTNALLAILPAQKMGIIKASVVINSLSGISGAGKKAKENLLFTERSERVVAYNPGTSHRHSYEIQQELENKIFFTPHLVPIIQGMESTIWFELKSGFSQTDIQKFYFDTYANAPFVTIQEKIPSTSQVRGTNRCDISLHFEENHLILSSVSDNLFKGASGQAVQNMNLRFGFDEIAGLPMMGEL
jgi:N-acetyl-gamma-glutamyl-phosphate reductase